MTTIETKELDRNTILQTLRELKPMLEREYFVHSIGLFGSFARGDETDESDIDIIVEVDPKIGLRFFSLADYFESIFGRKVDLVSTRAVKERFRHSIYEDIVYV